MGTKGELENRDRDEGRDMNHVPLSGSLGELPEDLSEERGDLETYSTLAVGAMKPDVIQGQRSRVDAKQTGLGSPALNFTVRSVYDSRPVNSRDFNLWFSTINGGGCGANDYAGFRNCFYVPLGYVAVVRRIEVLFPDLPIAPLYNALIAVTVNGTIQDPDGMTVGGPVGVSTPAQLAGIPVLSPGDIETFVIADENELVGVRLTETAGYQAADAEILVGFYGNFLLKTGMPANAQIANLGGKAAHAVTSSPKDLTDMGPGPSGADMVVRRKRKASFSHVPILRR